MAQPYVPVEPEADLESDPGADPGFATGWSVPWSDLMMVMFVLFAMLYAYKAAERDVRRAAPEPVGAMLRTPDDVFDHGRAAIHDNAIDQVEVSVLGDRSVLYSLHGPLLFDLGKADLRQEILPTLDRVANVIRRTPYRVRVAGHTDPYPIHTPRYSTNWELSAARASRVARYLIETADLDPSRFTVVGHALYRTEVPNTSPSNRARNRRVEIVITRETHAGGAEELP